MKHKILIHFFLQTLLFIFLSGQQSLFSQGCYPDPPPEPVSYGTIHVTGEYAGECICVCSPDGATVYCTRYADDEGNCDIRVVCDYEYSVYDPTGYYSPNGVGFKVPCGETVEVWVPQGWPTCECKDNTKTGTMETADFRLAQNYPNPFNPVTKINYYIALPTEVKLTVYDVLGNEIALLVNEFESPGAYSVDFDGSNLPSGVYIYKIEAGTFSAVKKLLLMK